MEAFRSNGAVILRRNGAMLAIPAIVATFGFVLVLLGWADLYALEPLGQLLALGGIFGTLGAWIMNPFRRETTVMLEADAHGVRADGLPLLSRAEIAEGYVQPSASGPTVKLRTRRLGRSLEIRLGGAEDSRALLSALHLDAGQARVTFWAPSPVLVSLRLQILLAAVWVAVFVLALNMIQLGLGPVVAVYALLYFVPRRVVAGADGVRIAWMGRGKFIPYSAVSRVYLDGEDIVIDLRSGGRERVPFKQPLQRGWDLMRALFAPQKTAIVERIEEGVRAHERIVVDRDAGGLLARGGRTATEWLNALHALGSRATDYRTVTMPADLLWRIAENAAAPPLERAAAAVALRETLDDDGRARLRGLAEATAAPKVRVAIEAAAGPTDEETLARALDECDEDVPEDGEPARRVSGGGP